jgi:zinc/manganese transport system permease protein
MIANIFAYDFMVRAFLASGIVAVVAGTTGYILVLRGQTFAGHALAHVAFAGAAGAAFVGAAPLAGVVVFTVGAGVAMGSIGERLSGRDVVIGIVLALSLAFGVLFLRLADTTAAQATSLLFGSVLVIAPAMLGWLLVLAILTLGGLALISRPLIFSSLQPELAEARGVPVRGLGTAFLALVGLTVALSAQIVGVLLVFALMVGPPAAAQLLTHRLAAGVALAAGLAVSEAWLGITLSFYTDLPTSFWITGLSAVVYFAALGFSGRRHHRGSAIQSKPGSPTV